MHTLRRVLPAAAVALSLFGAPAGFAAGPLLLCAPGTPFAWPGPTSFFTDEVSVGPVLTLAEADALTMTGFTEWSAVATSSFAAASGGGICAQVGCPAPLPGPPGDVTLATIGLVVGVFNGGGFSVVYDDTGLIISTFFGAPPGVLGIASPDFGTPFPACALTESWAVINLSAVDPGDTGPPPGALFGGVFTHEFGHAINLAHSQTSGSVHFFGDNSAPGACTSVGAPTTAEIETMYPFLDVSPPGTGADQATVDLPDDIASISNLHPTGGWPGVAGTIAGTVFDIDGVTPLGGVNVVARSTVAPFGDSVSALTGDFTQTAGDGTYALNGLTPGVMYTVHAEAIVMGGFSQTPVAPLPGDGEEYFNGAGENNFGMGAMVDPVCTSTTITAVAGSPATADIMLNDPTLPVELFRFEISSNLRGAASSAELAPAARR